MSLNSLLRQTITIENPDGTKDKQGRDNFGASTTTRARVQKTTKVVMTADREREPIDAIIFVSPGTTINKSARLVYQAVQYRVIKIEDVVGKNGTTHHFEVMVQLWSYKAGA